MSEIVNKIIKIDLDTTSPKECMNILTKIQSELKKANE